METIRLRETVEKNICHNQNNSIRLSTGSINIERDFLDLKLSLVLERLD